MLTALLGGGAGRVYAVGFVSSATSGTDLVANASPGGDGAWTELTSATPDEFHAIHLLSHYGGSTTGRGIIDVAIGQSGSERTIIEGLPFAHMNSNIRSSAWRISMPLYIPSGSRIAARVRRSDTASLRNRLMMLGETLPIRGIPPFRRCTTYGLDVTNARGTQVSPGGTANTQGSITEIVASTTNPIRALHVIAMKRDGVATAGNNSTALQILIGAAGSEVELIPEHMAWEIHSSCDVSSCFGLGIGPFPVNVPAGSRLSARARCSGATVGEIEGQVMFLGLD
jgi:hypothetical protein